MINQLLMMMSSGAAPVITLSGQSPSASDASAPYDSLVGIRITLSGVVQEKEQTNGSGGWTTVDPATDWIIPNSSAGDDTYHYKYAYTGDTLNVGSDTIGSWQAFDGTKTFWLDSTVFESLSGGGLLELSNDGGSTTLASATYNLTLDNL